MPPVLPFRFGVGTRDRDCVPWNGAVWGIGGRDAGAQHTGRGWWAKLLAVARLHTVNFSLFPRTTFI